MKKIVCPACGEVNFYYNTVTERYGLFYDANGNPQGKSDGNSIYDGTVNRCERCGRKVKIIDTEADLEKAVKWHE